MRARMFKAQFANKVFNGTKRQTVRPKPKRAVKVGDQESWRQWTGLPYRSPQQELAKVVITEVRDIWFNGVTILFDEQITTPNSQLMSMEDQEAFARADGFDSLRDMSDWFQQNHGLPFQGILIKAKTL